MSDVIYFREQQNRHGVIRFVKKYRPGGFLRRERIEYTYDAVLACTFENPATINAVFKRVRKDYPHADVDNYNLSTFIEGYCKHRFFLISKWDYKDNLSKFYAGEKKHTVDWTDDINNALLGMDEKTQADTLNRIRMRGEKVNLSVVYSDLINDLLNPNFMITCESKKGKKELKYFARKEGNRLRLVETSNAAAKFSYREVMDQYEELQATNKNFLYSVIPALGENVSCKNLLQYLKWRKISTTVQMELKINSLNG